MFPLANRSILITRSRDQASALATHLQALGAQTILVPTIEIVPPPTFAPLDEAIANLDHFDWLIFTSANAVQAFHERSANHDSHALAHIRTAAIGPATAHAATKIGLKVVLIPELAVAESLAAALVPLISPATRILLVRAAVARNHLPEALQATGAQVTIVEAYQTRIPASSVDDLRRIFNNPARYPDAVTFASSSTVTNFLTLLETAALTLPPSVIRASIGPITTRTMCDHGFPPDVEAPEASIPSLVKALAEYIGNLR